MAPEELYAALTTQRLTPPTIPKWFQDRTSDRKVRLFMVALCRSLEGFLWLDDACIRAVTVAERYADGHCSGADLEQSNLVMSYQCADHLGDRVREAIFRVTLDNALEGIIHCAHYMALATAGSRWTGCPWDPALDARLAVEHARQCRLLRCLFGDLFGVSTFESAWRTSDVLSLARGIYADRAFDRMPILADALQDAGCDNDAILSHCRDTNAPHARGCWVCDLVLEKA